GGAIGSSLLLHIPLLAGMTATAVITYGLLMWQQLGFRPLELVIGAIVGLICICYLIEMFIAPIDWGAALFHTVTPQLADREAVLLAVGIIGATVMPHAIYLHSGLTQARVPVRNDDDRRLALRYSNREVVIALIIFSGRADVMGAFANGRAMRVIAICATALVLALNAVLICLMTLAL